jgi:hypothetical protein
MTNTAIRLHLVRTLTAAPAAHEGTETWDLTVDSLRSAHEVLEMHRDGEDWVTASAEGPEGYLGSGRAGFGEVRSDWA